MKKMNKIFKIILCLLLIASFAPIWDKHGVQAATPDLPITDDFEDSDLPTTAISAGTLGGYTVSQTKSDTIKPTVQVVTQLGPSGMMNNKALYFNDTSAVTGVMISRNFTKQTGKTIIAELDFRQDPATAMPENIKVLQLRNSSNNSNWIVDIETKKINSVVTIANRIGGNYTQIVNPAEYVPGTWYHVKATVDLNQVDENNKTNGVTIDITAGAKSWSLTNQSFHTEPSDASGKNLGYLNVSSGDGGVGNFYVDNIKVYELQTKPAKPFVNEVTPGNTQIALAWGAASGASSYSISRSETKGKDYQVIAPNVSALYYEDSGLTNGKTYYYIVTAINTNGTTDSEEVSVTPSDNVPLPNVPNNLTARLLDSSTLVTWNGVPEAESYILTRSTSFNGTYTDVSPKVKITGTQYLDTGLSNDTTYYYKVASRNVAGRGQDTSAVTITPTAPLASPSGLSAAAGNGRVDLSWNPVATAASYTIKRSTVNGGSEDDIFFKGIKTTSYSDTTAVNNTVYYYVVTAVNTKTESMISNQVRAVPGPVNAGAPAAPTGFTAAADNGKVSLSWNAVPGASSYTVKRGTASGGLYTTISSGITTLSYVDSSVTNGITYYYAISATNSKGESLNTDELILVPAPVITVAKDGTGNFTTINAALNSISSNTSRQVIFIKSGEYREKINVTLPYISFVGEGKGITKIVYGDYAGADGKGNVNGGGTFVTQTVKVTGNFFTASNLTIQNDAYPRSVAAQAVALSSSSDQSVFDNVELLGYQDTLYTGTTGKQYFRNSTIKGDVDFIFGEAPAVVFDNVDVVTIGIAGSNGGGHVTAAAQVNETDPGFVFFNSRILKDSSTSGNYDLGRPWKTKPSTRFINTWMDSQIIAAGWTAWNVQPINYGEYNSTGPGANPGSRSSALSRQLSVSEASYLTIPRIFGGWDPTQTVIIPKAVSQTITPNTVVFDKNVSNQSNLNVTVQSPVYAVSAVANGSITLNSASDYSMIGNGITINKSYLSKLPFGITTLQIQFKNGVSLPLAVKVMDSTFALQTLPSNESWASFQTGVTGGLNAGSENVYFVSNRTELVQALGGNNSTNASNVVPKIIYIQGTIDMNYDDVNHKVLGLEDYSAGTGYDLNEYLKAYDPATYGRTNVPSGTQETARAAAQKKQGDQVKINVGSNTTIVGLGNDAKIIGGNLMIKSNNVIIRNIEFQDAYDYFPQWDPTDGSSGNWNSQYDLISIQGAAHVWIDHNTFSDGNRPDSLNGKYYGREYQHHDGLVDITNQADLVTMSYNVFRNHDKTSLIGGSDSAVADIGKLRVTIHHNYFENIIQRAPRVRFGQVHVYNNYFNSLNKAENLYSIGVGAAAQVVSEANYFEGVRVPVAYYDSASIGAVKDTGSYFVNSGKPSWKPNVNWDPKAQYVYTPDPAVDVKAKVLSNAGVGQPGNTLTAPDPVETAGLKAESTTGAQINLTWSTVANATYYVVKRSTTSGGPYTIINPSVTVADPNAQEATYVDSNVTSGSTYYYLVTAAGSTGEYVTWNEASAKAGGGTAPVQVPAAPTNLTATSGVGIVNLSWNTVTGATYYNVKRSTTSGAGYQVVATNVTGTSYVDNGLNNNTTYYYVVTAGNSGGEGVASSEVNVKTQPAPVQVPAAPTNLTATSGVGTVNLSWNTVTGATYYNVKRSTTSGTGYQVVATNVSGTSYVDNGLNNNTTYYYVVTAGNSKGEGPASSEVNVKTQLAPVQVPVAPTNLAATAGVGTVNLSWSTVTGATYYVVKRSTTKGGTYTTISANVTSPTYTDTGLMAGTTYYYVVTAAHAAGESVSSAEVSATPYFISSHSSSTTSSGGGGGSSTPSPTVDSTKEGVQINNVQPVIEKTADGKSVAKVSIEGTTLTQVLDALKASSEQRISLEVKGSEAIGKIELPAVSLADMISKAPAAVLSVKFSGATYDLPLKTLDVSSLAKALGSDTKDVKISITIEKVTGTTATAIEAKAKQAGLKPLVSAVDFNVTADAKGKQISVNDFGKTYVSRTIELAKEVDAKKTTVVLYNPVTGAMSFVPATFSTVGGITKATIKRTGNSIYSVVESNKTFGDLKGHWSQADVELLASKLVINGVTDDSFAPQKEITRAEFAALLVRALGLSETSAAQFSDVLSNDWFAGAIGAASKAGLVDGFENGTFQPGANITREQMAVMITRAMNVAGKKAAADAKGLAGFADTSSISGWAKDAVAQSVNAGIINGVTDASFVPTANASRAEAAVMLKRLLQYVQFMN